MKSLHLPVDLPAVCIEPAVADTRIAGNQATHAGHTQAALPIRIHLFTHGRDFRIDQDRQRNRRGIWIAWVLVDPEDHDAKRHTDLSAANPAPSKAFMVFSMSPIRSTSVSSPNRSQHSPSVSAAGYPSAEFRVPPLSCPPLMQKADPLLWPSLRRTTGTANSTRLRHLPGFPQAPYR